MTTITDGKNFPTYNRTMMDHISVNSEQGKNLDVLKKIDEFFAPNGIHDTNKDGKAQTDEIVNALRSTCSLAGKFKLNDKAIEDFKSFIGTETLSWGEAKRQVMKFLLGFIEKPQNEK